MEAAYLTDRDIAKLFGMSPRWLWQHREELEQRGFPKKDALIGRTLKADVEAWLARQRKVSDHAGVVHSGDDTTTRINTDAL